MSLERWLPVVLIESCNENCTHVHFLHEQYNDEGLMIVLVGVLHPYNVSLDVVVDMTNIFSDRVLLLLHII